MSVRKNPRGAGYIVRWEAADGRQPQRTFRLKGDAVAWNRLKAEERDRAGLPPDVRRMKFRELYGERFVPNHVALLDAETQKGWERKWYPSERSIARGFKPQLWHLRVKWANVYVLEITFEAVTQWLGEMKRAGASDATMFRAHDALVAVLNYAWRANLIPSNPAAQVRRPKYRAPKVKGIWLPEQIEAIRDVLLEKAANGRRDFRWARARDAVLVSTLGYGALRTFDEGMLLDFSQLQRRTLLLEDTKTHESRTVPLPDIVMNELRRWRIESGLRSGLVFPRSPTDPRPISAATWSRHVWEPAIRKALGEDAYKSPYHLRHSCVSMWLAEGVKPTEVARRAGHTIETLYATYAHVIEDLDENERYDMAAAIQRLRIFCALGDESVPVGG